MKQHGVTMEEPMTIQDVVRITGRSATSVYRYLKRGKLKYTTVKEQGKIIYHIKKPDLERFLGYSVDTNKQHGGTMKEHGGTMKEHGGTSGETMVEHGGTSGGNGKQQGTTLTIENLHKAIQDVISQQQSQLMKPLEEQALFIAGSLTKENHFLRQKVETLLQELEQYKALPGPVEKVLDELKEKDQKLEETETQKKQLEIDLQEKIETLARIKNEKKHLQIQQAKVQSDLETLQKENSAYKEARGKYDELENQLKEKEVKLSALEQEKFQLEEEQKTNETLLYKSLQDMEEKLETRDKEKEELEVKLQKEREELEVKLQAEEQVKKNLETRLKEIEEQKEKEKQEIAEAWKKELEAARRPWWKIW